MTPELTVESVRALAERVKLINRGFDTPSCVAPSIAPIADPEDDQEAWRLLASAASQLSWLFEGTPGKAADWNEPRSLATVLVDLADVESLTLRFRTALTERLRELAAEGGEP